MVQGWRGGDELQITKCYNERKGPIAAVLKSRNRNFADEGQAIRGRGELRLASKKNQEGNDRSWRSHCNGAKMGRRQRQVNQSKFPTASGERWVRDARRLGERERKRGTAAQRGTGLTPERGEMWR